MSLSFWAIHSCQYEGRDSSHGLQALFRVGIFGFHWLIQDGPACIVKGGFYRTSEFYWRREELLSGEDTDYRKGCIERVVQSMVYSYSCSASKPTVDRECQPLFILE